MKQSEMKQNEQHNNTTLSQLNQHTKTIAKNSKNQKIIKQMIIAFNSMNITLVT